MENCLSIVDIRYIGANPSLLMLGQISWERPFFKVTLWNTFFVAINLISEGINPHVISCGLGLLAEFAWRVMLQLEQPLVTEDRQTLLT